MSQKDGHLNYLNFNEYGKVAVVLSFIIVDKQGRLNDLFSVNKPLHCTLSDQFSVNKPLQGWLSD